LINQNKENALMRRETDITTPAQYPENHVSNENVREGASNLGSCGCDNCYGCVGGCSGETVGIAAVVAVAALLICGSVAGAGFTAYQTYQTLKSDQPWWIKTGRLALTLGCGVGGWFAGEAAGSAILAEVGQGLGPVATGAIQYGTDAVFATTASGIGAGVSRFFQIKRQEEHDESSPLIKQHVFEKYGIAPETDSRSAQPKDAAQDEVRIDIDIPQDQQPTASAYQLGL
jgi:hypothetical protein